MGIRRYLQLAAAHLNLGIDPRTSRARRSLSRRYIRGRGLEIGALHEPLWVAPDVTVDYVDYITRDEAISRYPELDADKIVEPRYLDDGFVLGSIPDGSQDFVIANHVLEHGPNPIQALLNWRRTLRPGGVLFVTVPIAERCFDRGRVLTELAHLVEDRELCLRNETVEFRRRNRDHFCEWLTISAPAIERENGRPATVPSGAELESLLDEFPEDAEIHYHTFSVDSFGEMLRYFTEQIAVGMRVEKLLESWEVIAVLREAEGS